MYHHSNVAVFITYLFHLSSNIKNTLHSSPEALILSTDALLETCKEVMSQRKKNANVTNMPPRRKRGQVVSESQTSASGPGFEFFGKNKTVRAVYVVSVTVFKHNLH